MSVTPPQVLIVEDEPAHAEAIRRAFRTAATPAVVRVVATLAEYREAVAETRPDVALLDLNLADGRATDVLAEPPDGAPFPIVIMTSHGDERAAVTALKSGALDYVVKSPETFRFMPHTVARALREWGQRTARARAEARVVHLNAVLRAIRNVNQLITQEKDAARLLAAACERLTGTLGYRSVWIGLAAAGGQLRLAAASGLTADAAERVRRELADCGLPSCALRALAEAGVTARVLPHPDCAACELHTEAPGCGVLSARLEHAGTVYGLVTAAVPDEFVTDPEEQDLFFELAGDLAFALWRIELERAHAAQEQEILSISRFPEEDPSPVLRFDPQGHVLYANPASAALMAARGDRGDPEPLLAAIAAAHGTGLPREIELTAGAGVFACTVTPVSGHGYVNVYARDVSSQKQAEAALRESESQARAIFDHLPGPALVWQRDADGFALVALNDAARTLTGWAPPAVVGRSTAELPHGIPALEEDLDRCFGQRVVVQREVDYRRDADAPAQRLAATYGFVPPDRVLLHAQDVTELRRTEEQLRVAQRMESIGRLAGGVAHDFNNLLAVVLSYTEFILDDLPEGEPLREDVLEVRRAGERAADLTRQLLAFSRRQLLQPQVLDLNEVVRRTEKMLRRLLGEDVEVTTALAAELGKVRADPGQVDQIIMNLAVNARDAMPNGGRLLIETANVDLDEAYADAHVGTKAGAHVMLSVTDTGAGMDAATKARLFEPFFTTKEAGKGTGLGLATVYGIVKQSGGNVWVYSEPGRGTTFKVYLPLESGAEAEAPRSPRDVRRATGNETVLVVEDEEAVRKLALRILRGAGYTVLGAANGDEALQMCERHEGTIHLLLTDVVMPGMSGKDLALRLVKVRPELRVLYMSGYTDNAIFHHGVLDAGLSFVSKPFGAPELTRKVRAVLDAKR